MRLVLLLPLLSSVAAPAYADGARESRYGPAVTHEATVAAAYTGPLLNWSSRQAPAATVAPAPRAQPMPVASWARYQPVATAASPAMTPPAGPAALPDSLYAAPRAATVPTAAPVAPAPVRQQVAAVGGPTGARFYSVDRDAGLTPDPIPAIAPDNRVLISAEAPAPAPEDATPMHGSADWLAAGVSGDDDQDSDGDRRAKTRKQDQ